jgi:hypothetical protein
MSGLSLENVSPTETELEVMIKILPETIENLIKFLVLTEFVVLPENHPRMGPRTPALQRTQCGAVYSNGRRIIREFVKNSWTV